MACENRTAAKARATALVGLGLCCGLALGCGGGGAASMLPDASDSDASVYDALIDGALVDASPPDANLTPPNFVFTTSTVHDGNLGGLAGADAICQARAAAAGLPGTYRAWLGTSTANAQARIEAGGARGWIRPDGRPLVDQLLEAKIKYPPRLDEYGNDLGDSELVWTSASENGSMVPQGSCNDWTTNDPGTNGRLGAPHRGPVNWTESPLVVGCSQQHHLYCFGIDRYSVLAVPTPVAGRLAFITNTDNTGNIGPAGFDAACMDRAVAEGLPGTYKALISVDGQPPASRFDVNGLPWVRLDGIPLAATAAKLFSGELLDAPLALRPDGAHVNTNAWTGAVDFSTVAAQTCNNWSGGAGTRGSAGLTTSTSPVEMFAQSAVLDFSESCDDAKLAVYCLQE